MISNPLKSDPTRTVTLRRHFFTQLRKVYKKLAFQITDLLVRENALGVNTRWLFHPIPEKIKAFESWLRAQLGNVADLWRSFIEVGFKKGAGRAFDDTRMRKLRKERPDLFTPERQDSLRDFYQGSREEFLRSSFANPASRDALEVLVSRTLTEYKNVNEDMSTKMIRMLADGLTRGDNPRVIARRMVKQLGLSFKKAEMIARTELIRAHAEGQLASMERLGVQELNIMVEWDTAGDKRVCPKCKPMDGVTFLIGEAHGIIPYHPNCRCAWIPAIV